MRGGKRVNAGRPEGPKHVKIQAWVSPATKKRIIAVAFTQEISYGAVIDQMATLKKDEKLN